MFKKISSLFFLGFTYLSLAFPVFGQSINPCPGNQGGKFGSMCYLDATTLAIAIRNGVTILFIIATIAALFFLIAGGIKWITSGGDKANLEQARNWIVAAAVGLIITFLSYFIINLILHLFGLPDITSYTLPNLVDPI